MEQQKTLIRTALMPLYYRDFHCLAADCRNNCCGGWEITFNKKDYLRIKRAAQSGELKEILARGMSRLRKTANEEIYAHFCSAREGRCEFQTEEGLCRLQMECGAEALPTVCRDYPRRGLYTAAGKELSLSLTCEGVLALLWDLPQGIDFWEEPLPEREWKQMELPPRMARFADIRSFCIDVLQERSLPFFQRMQLLGVLLQRLKETDWTEGGVVDAWLARGEDLLHGGTAGYLLAGLPRNQVNFLAANIRVLSGMYSLKGGKTSIYRDLFSAISADPDWEERGLQKFTMDLFHYQAMEKKLEELLSHSDYFFENLMVSAAFYETFPDVRGPEELWRSYVFLCGLYGFYRFAAVCGCTQEVSRERLFYVIGMVSRSLLHGGGELKNKFINELQGETGGTLAHMAILAGG